jgi:UTP--glucose-1-phosphate uridylyltransferase
VIKGRRLEERLYHIMDMVEKPEVGQAPSDLAIIGRYILTPEIFPALEKTVPDRSGEIQLTNALKSLLRSKRHMMYALEFQGRWHDAGTILGFLKTTVEFALQRPDVAPGFREFLRRLDLDSGASQIGRADGETSGSGPTRKGSRRAAQRP